MSTTIEAVVFDYGGVLTTPVGDSVRTWLEADGIVPESFTRTLRAWLGRDAAPGTPIHLLEAGALSVAEFDVLLAAELETHSGAPVASHGVLKRLFAAMRPDEAMWQLASDLQESDVRVALLSNSWGDFYPHERLAALFDPIVISERVGLRKPDPAIFELVLSRLGIEPAQAVFIDDAVPNLDGARAVGLHPIHHTDAITTRKALADLVPALTEEAA